MSPTEVSIAASTPLRAVLERCGFVENWTAPYADEQPGYCFDFGDLRLEAVRVTSMYLRPIFQFGGVRSTPRSLGMISFELPVMVESFEQGAAWITDALRRQGYMPGYQPDWYRLGLEHRGSLPWERKMAAYGQRPQCSVAREWFRTAARSLRENAAVADAVELAWLSFDGEVLKIRAGMTFVAMPGFGQAWPSAFGVHAAKLDFLPQRIAVDPLHVSVWEGRLSIHNRVWNVVETIPRIGSGA